MSFSAHDLQQLERRGLGVEEAERQLELLRQRPPVPRVIRPCGLGDGIVRIEPEREPELLEAWRRAAAGGRWSKFVPASGAASRMFAALEGLMIGSEGEVDPADEEVKREARELVRRAGELAFFESWSEALAARGRDFRELVRAGELRLLLRALLERPGLGYSTLAKGLILFHRYPEGPRTAFEEQLVEATHHLTDGAGECRVHFTVADDQRAGFDRARGALGAHRGCSFRVAFSSQHPSTDTLAIDDRGRPFRDAGGALLFRPGGHGALLGNLAGAGGDLVFVKNIDNVAHARRHPLCGRWKRLLGGYLASLAGRIDSLLAELEEGGGQAVVERGFALLASAVAFEPPAEMASAGLEARHEFLVRRLDRPLRVCGVVVNEGEPGGGPFWVEGPDGAIAGQIVEAAQLAGSRRERRRLLRDATHFNPVDLVCALRDRQGGAHDLDRFVDSRAAFVASKTHQGRELTALERPGLWNGAMAGWNTVFVEVPSETFTPVKSVFDLLRPEHLEPRSAPGR